MSRKQPVTVPLVTLFAIIPFYLYIGSIVPSWTLHAPESALDRMIEVQPAWSLIYLSLFLAALLPVFVLHQEELIRRTILAYLVAWLVAYACFLLYPTVGPQTRDVSGAGFSVWAVREIYSSDVHYNCFPSLHVAQCFLAAFATSRVHRVVGILASAWATLVAISTVLIKQHYVADAIGGVVLAAILYFVFLRRYPSAAIPEYERRLAPLLATLALGAYALIVAILWLVYWLGDGKVY